MAIKDLFGKKSNKMVTAQDAENISNEVESKDFVRAEVSRRNTFIPRANFNEPKNYVKNGSAEKYNVEAIILEGVMTSIKDVIIDLNSFKFKIIPFDLLLRYNFNSIESLKKIDVPILFLHSINDELVKYSHAEQIFNLTKNSNKQLITLDGEHQNAHFISYDIYIEGIKSFLNNL